MSTFYKPVLPYKPSFDSTKGEKNRMEINYTIQIPGAGRGRGARAAQVQHMRRMVEVRICESTSVDEILWTINRFERERSSLQMPWADARFNFANCLGEIPKERLEKVCTKYEEENDGTGYTDTQEGFKQMVKDFIKDLCKDGDAKGTLKREVLNGLWNKPMAKDIAEHSITVQSSMCRDCLRDKSVKYNSLSTL